MNYVRNRSAHPAPPLLLPPQTCCGARDLPAARSPAAWRRLPRCDAPPHARRRHPIGASCDVCVSRRRGDVDSPTALSPEPRPPPAVADLCCTLVLRLSCVLVGGPTTTTRASHTCSANRPPQLRPSTARSPETHFHGLLLLHHAAAAGVAGGRGRRGRRVGVPSGGSGAPETRSMAGGATASSCLHSR
jgi:hypothetical protein